MSSPTIQGYFLNVPHHAESFGMHLHMGERRALVLDSIEKLQFSVLVSDDVIVLCEREMGV